MSIRQRVATGVLWTGIEGWLTQVLSFIAVLMLARLLGPEPYGLVAMVLVFTNVANAVLGHGGWIQSIVQRRDLESGHMDTAFWFVFAVAGTLTGGMILLAPWIAELYGQPDVETLVLWLSPTMILTALASIQVARLKRALKFGVLAARSIAAVSIASVIAVVMAVEGFGIWSLVALHLAQGCISVVLLWVMSPWRPGLRVSRQHFRDLSGHGFSMAGTKTIHLLSRSATRFLIGYFLGPAALGIFSLAMRIFEVLGQALIAPLHNVAMPTFAYIQKNREKVEEMFMTGTQLACLVVYPAGLGLAVIAPDLMPYALGEAWTESVPTLQILLAMTLTLPIGAFANAVLMGTGHAGVVFRITLFSFAALLVALFAGFTITRESVTIIALVYVLRSPLITPITLYAIKRKTGIAAFRTILRALPILLSAGLMVGAVVAARQALADTLSPPQLIAACVGVGAVSYSAFAWVIARSARRHAIQTVRTALRRPAKSAPAPAADEVKQAG